MQKHVQYICFFFSIFLLCFPVQATGINHESEGSIQDSDPISIQYENTGFSKEYRAVLIGIDDYPGGYGADLPFSVNEISMLKETLLDGLNWEASEIKMLTDKYATIANLLITLSWVKENADDNDVTMIYFTGHGGKTDDHEYIIMYDDHISDSDLDMYLSGIKGTIIVVIDACYSGGFREELAQPGRIVLTACGKANLTYQVDDLKSGIFGYYFNLSLKYLTKRVETTFLFTKVFSQIYSARLSETYQKNYHVNPVCYDGTLFMTKLLSHHAYLKHLFPSLVTQSLFTQRPRIWTLSNDG